MSRFRSPPDLQDMGSEQNLLPPETASMARVEITEEELYAGLFPKLCAKTGEPTTNVEVTRIRLPHPLSLLLLFPAIVPYLIYRFLLAPRASVGIPLSRSVQDLRRRQYRYLILTGAAGSAIAASGFFLPVGAGRVIAFAGGLLISLVAQIGLVASRRESTVGIARTRDATIVVDRIHPRFRDALAHGHPHRTAQPELEPTVPDDHSAPDMTPPPTIELDLSEQRVPPSRSA